jgi:hypothetical protein
MTWQYRRDGLLGRKKLWGMALVQLATDRIRASARQHPIFSDVILILRNHDVHHTKATLG